MLERLRRKFGPSARSDKESASDVLLDRVGDKRVDPDIVIARLTPEQTLIGPARAVNDIIKALGILDQIRSDRCHRKLNVVVNGIYLWDDHHNGEFLFKGDRLPYNHELLRRTGLAGSMRDRFDPPEPTSSDVPTIWVYTGRKPTYFTADFSQYAEDINCGTEFAQIMWGGVLVHEAGHLEQRRDGLPKATLQSERHAIDRQARAMLQAVRSSQF